MRRAMFEVRLGIAVIQADTLASGCHAAASTPISKQQQRNQQRTPSRRARGARAGCCGLELA